jgi:hypothetical protein
VTCAGSTCWSRLRIGLYPLARRCAGVGQTEPALICRLPNYSRGIRQKLHRLCNESGWKVMAAGLGPASCSEWQTNCCAVHCYTLFDIMIHDEANAPPHVLQDRYNIRVGAYDDDRNLSYGELMASSKFALVAPGMHCFSWQLRVARLGGQSSVKGWRHRLSNLCAATVAFLDLSADSCDHTPQAMAGRHALKTACCTAPSP